ncbi:YkgJ family cysteine cluster protein [Halosolutus amylolyticus]|uniref:YkgJ family cysteine cluster protein n=1 Tax=Halosolutus amylolyticus TaxID=2932267 RepID=A0ABD5PKH8_9EURY|nr:YkgJ family cysteine cluster protein [Halosolutus amylolyticus]
MEVHCEGCAGCCLDWRSLLESADGRDGGRSQPDRRGPRNPDADGPRREPLDDDPTFVPLTRDEVRTVLDRGLAAAMTPRFWRAADESEGVEIDEISVAAVAGRPAFFVGLRKPPKPVAPFDREEPAWLPTCVFLDPTTLQCRIHNDEALFPDECGAYPEHNLALDQETECERVEAAFGGDRLVDDGHDDRDGLLLGSQAIGAKLFCHPGPERLEGIVGRAASGDLTATDRAELVAVAAASSPGTIAISEPHYEEAKAKAIAAGAEGGPGEHATGRDGPGETWVGPAIQEWAERHRQADGTVPPADVAKTIEEARGAPETPGWDAIE